MATRSTVVVLDKDPRHMRSLLQVGDPAVMPCHLLVMQFSLHFDSLVDGIVSINPNRVDLGGGFGFLPNTGEKFLAALQAAGFRGSIAVCCHDTFKVLPLSDIVWIEPKEGVARQAIAELVAKTA